MVLAARVHPGRSLRLCPSVAPLRDQNFRPVVLGVLVLLALGGVPACDFADGTPILASEDDGGGDASVCDLVDCMSSCIAAGHRTGSCHGDSCVCDDTPPVDADADAEAEADGDADVEAEAETDDDGGADDGEQPCEAVLSRVQMLGERAADADERPVALASGSGFVAFSRLAGPVSADGLRFQRVNLDGSAATSAMWSLSSVEIGPVHPLLELPDGDFVVAFSVPEGEGPGLWLKVLPSTGTGGEVPRQVPDTDARDTAPSLTFDGTELVAAWMQTAHGTGRIDLRIQRFTRTTGFAIGSLTTLRTLEAGSGEPRLAWGGGRFVLVYLSASDGALHVLSLDGAFAVLREDVLAPAADDEILGHPALVWNGAEFGLAWETVGFTGTVLRLATFGPGEAPVEHAILTELALPSSALPKQLALAWGDLTGEWGLAWHFVTPARDGIALARIDGVDFHTLDGPVDIAPGSRLAAHPGLAYNAGTYMVIWTDDPGASGTRSVYEATYGCRP